MLKRGFDFILALVIFILFFPVFLACSMLLIIINKGTPFFFQTRPGKNEKLFKIIKFKTMTDARDAKGELLPDKERITWIGNIIRKTSLDEIPQLLNVIKGDMALVGPRPLLPEYLPLYDEEQKKRHLVKPGITGWAQVNGRNAISWKEKFKYDVWYVENQSFLLDVKILFLTVKKVFKSEGISAANSVTMEKFRGNLS
jgi:lipopolysaccharide/colanic/teichoic acid biosynthesis glycosyltransferase